MPNKHPQKKGWLLRKQKYKVANWSEYNKALRDRGNIEIWLSDDAIAAWYKKDLTYTGAGAPK